MKKTWMKENEKKFYPVTRNPQKPNVLKSNNTFSLYNSILLFTSQSRPTQDVDLVGLNHTNKQ